MNCRMCNSQNLTELVSYKNYPIFIGCSDNKIDKELVNFSLILNLVLVELAVILSFFPMTVWYSSLFVMSFFYIGIGLMQSFIKGRLFLRTFVEYSLVAGFIGVMFLFIFPGK